MERPRYQQISEHLRAQIQGGQHPSGSLLPSEHELAGQFQTTRTTVRQALGELVRQGFIERQQGRGSVVRSERQALGLLSFRGFSEAVGKSNHVVRTEFLQKPTRQAWPTHFFQPLSPDERAAGCIALERLRYADDNPVMHETTFVPNFAGNTLTSEAFVDGSLFKTLSLRHGIAIENLEQTLRAQRTDATQSRVFGCPKNTPLLYLERRYITSRAGFFVYSQLFCFTEKYALSSGV